MDFNEFCGLMRKFKAVIIIFTIIVASTLFIPAQSGKSCEFLLVHEYVN